MGRAYKVWMTNKREGGSAGKYEYDRAVRM